MSGIPKVSVVMPAYNAEKTIRSAIESVLRQTFGDLELIVIDDCSRDGTVQIAEEYCRCDDRVHIQRNAVNLGVSESRNNGVRAAKSDWIAFLDSDDLWEPEKIEKQLNVIEENPVLSLCFTGSAFVDESGKKYGFSLSVPERISYKDLLKQNLISCSSVLVRKELLLLYPMKNDPLIHEDFAVWLQILRDEPFAVGINEPLLIYRLSGSSKSGNKLRAAKMQWRTYRYIGICGPKAAVYFIVYAFRSLHKYFNIKRSAE